MQLDAVPSLYLRFLRLKRHGHWSADWVLNQSTEIVIDGYPRSANSFAFDYFRHSQERAWNIATHVHASAQVVVACRRRIPVLLLLRHPRDAVLSLAALTAQDHEALTQAPAPLPNFGIMLRNYRVFYERCLRVIDHCVIAWFDDVIAEPRGILRSLRSRYQLDLHVPGPAEHERVIAMIRSGAGHHLFPSKRRDEIKQRMVDRLEDPVYDSALAQASAVYERCLDHYRSGRNPSASS